MISYSYLHENKISMKFMNHQEKCKQVDIGSHLVIYDEFKIYIADKKDKNILVELTETEFLNIFNFLANNLVSTV